MTRVKKLLFELETMAKMEPGFDKAMLASRLRIDEAILEMVTMTKAALSHDKYKIGQALGRLQHLADQVYPLDTEKAL